MVKSKFVGSTQVAGAGTLKFVGHTTKINSLITNTTAKEVLASFADSQKPFAVSFIQVDPYTNDPDFPTAYDSADVITKLHLYDTSYTILAILYKFRSNRR